MGLDVVLYDGVPRHGLPRAERRRKGAQGALRVASNAHGEALADFIATGAASHLSELGRWRAYGNPRFLRADAARLLVEDIHQIRGTFTPSAEHQEALLELLQLAERCAAEDLYMDVLPD